VCLKTEWYGPTRLFFVCSFILSFSSEIRYELADLPPCTLALSDFPYSFPTFAARTAFNVNRMPSIPLETEAASSYYYLAEISLRRLMNRVRNAIKILSENIDTSAIEQLAYTLFNLEEQLQQWTDCLPPAIQFSPPVESQPPVTWKHGSFFAAHFFTCAFTCLWRPD
jgi:hypothetical protein